MDALVLEASGGDVLGPNILPIFENIIAISLRLVTLLDASSSF